MTKRPHARASAAKGRIAFSAMAIAAAMPGQSMSAKGAVGRSRAVRPARRRSRRSGQAGRRQGHARRRAVRHRDRDQILQDRGAARRAARCISSAAPMPPTGKCRKRSAPGARRPTRARPRRWSNSACSTGPAPALPGTRRRPENCSSAPPKPAIRAASPISPRSAAAARRPIRRARGSYWPRPPRPMRKRSISLV